VKDLIQDIYALIIFSCNG